MKFYVSIWCFIVSVDLVLYVSCQRLKAKESNSGYNEKSDVKERWQLEKMAFRRGLKVMDDKGKLVELTTDETPPPGSARRCLREDIHFNLYTQRNPTEPHELSVDMDSTSKDDTSWSFFNDQKLTYFITHGWVNGGDSESCYLIHKALLKDHDVNVIIVDWGSIAKSFYGWAVNHLKQVSQSIVGMIEFLKERVHLDPAKIILIGHSLGAHVMGIAGHLMNGTIGNIFGLDPAFPLFSLAVPGERISKGDAKHVQIIHTCTSLLGFEKAIGTSDFYPDGGARQSNCVIDIGGACSHGRAYEYYAESISSKTGFCGWECNDWDDFVQGTCEDDNFGKMGGLTPEPGLSGSYFLWTNPSEPFARGIDISRSKTLRKKINRLS